MLAQACDATASPTIKSEDVQTQRQHRGQFVPGQSGNPAGRPRGARNRANQDLEGLIDGEAEALAGRMIALALSGNVKALKLCMDRIMPPLTSRPVEIDLPDVKNITDIGPAMNFLMTAVCKGELEPIQAKSMFAMLEMRRRTFETIELEKLVALIEKKVSRDTRAI